MTTDNYCIQLLSISNKQLLRDIIVKLFRDTEKLGHSYSDIIKAVTKFKENFAEEKKDGFIIQKGDNLEKVISDKQWTKEYINPNNKKSTAPFQQTCKIEALRGYALFFWRNFQLYWKDGEVQKFEKIEDSVHYYDVFYWRSVETSDSQKETVGVARIKIVNWAKAEMRYFYHSQDKSTALASGKVERLETGTAIYICLEDITKNSDGSDNKKANTFIVLHNVDKEKSDFMIGCITSKRRLSNAIISSIVVFQKDTLSKDLENSQYLSNFENGKRRIINIDNRINYYLSGRQIRTEEGLYIDQIDKLLTDADVKTLKGFCGDFQNIYISTNEVNKHIKSYRIEITDDGIAKVIKDKERQIIDKGRARVLSDDKILLQFNFHFNPSARAFQYSLLLKKSEISGSNYLEGVYMGLVNSNLASGRVILKRLTEQEKNYFEPQRIRLLENASAIEELKKITGEDNRIINFFLDNLFNPFTDAGLSDVLSSVQQKPKNDTSTISIHKPLPKDIVGNYYCYFNVKAVSDKGNKKDSSRYGQRLYKVPLQITESKVFIKYEGDEGSNVIEGYYKYDGKSKVVLVCVSEYYYITIFFRTSIKPEFIYGMFNVLNDSDRRSEATIQSSYMVMHKLDSMAFSELKFEEPIEDLKELIAIEKELKIGIISKLFGHYQRTVLTREPNERKEKLNQLLPRWPIYRRVFWNSACYNSLRYNTEKNKKVKKEYLEDAKADLYRAYNHGFAMKYFGDKEYGQNGFPEELKQEIEMILEDIDKEDSNNTKIFKESSLKEILLKKFISFQYHD